MIKATGWKADLIDSVNGAARTLCKRVSEAEPEHVQKVVLSSIGQKITKRQAKIISGKFLSIYNAMKNINKSNYSIDTSMDEETFAYVDPYDKSHKINVGSLFFSSSNKGIDSKIGTIIHEISHFKNVLGTEDHAYGDDILDLNMIDSLKNADTLERFAEIFYNNL